MSTSINDAASYLDNAGGSNISEQTGAVAESMAADANEQFAMLVEINKTVQEISMTTNLLQKAHESQMAPIRSLGR